MADIWLYHPELDRYIEVPESAFLIQARSGWIQQDPPPPDEEEKAAEEEAKPAKKTASKKTPAKASDEE